MSASNLLVSDLFFKEVKRLLINAPVAKPIINNKRGMKISLIFFNKNFYECIKITNVF